MPDAAEQAAAWMVAEIDRLGYLEQGVAADNVERRFGRDLVYLNQTGSRRVLKRFRELTDATVVWDGQERAWRRRERHDGSRRRAE